MAKLLTIITKCSILDVAAVLDPPHTSRKSSKFLKASITIGTLSKKLSVKLLIQKHEKSLKSYLKIKQLYLNTFQRGSSKLTSGLLSQKTDNYLQQLHKKREVPR